MVNLGGADQDCAEPEKHNKQHKEITPLKELRSGYLWVSDLVSQTWCEQQMVYRFTLPTEKVDKPVITTGTDMHLARGLYG